jgi:hypothetical protein
MTEMRVYVAVAGLAALSLGHWFWRRATARDIAERWLAQHHYRVHRLRTVFWSGSPHFRATPFRNNDWAFDFKADVDDMRLGGTGKVRLRVWTDWLGMIDREPEISWDRMPTDADHGARAPETQWADAQIALLRRAASGESTFRPAGSDAAARSLFDQEVEHMLALNRRGLVTCSTPIAELRSGAQYAALMDVALTDEGRRVLEQTVATEAAARTSSPRF